MVGLLEPSLHMESRWPFGPCPCTRMFSTISAGEPSTDYCSLTDIWRLLTLPATSKQESLMDAYIDANYSDYTSSHCTSYTHCYFNPPFGKQDDSFVSPGHNLTWKELLAYDTSIRFTVRSLLVESKKKSGLYLLYWTLRPVLTERLHISSYLVLGVYNPLSPQNTSLNQSVTHARCHFAMKVRERPLPLKTPIQFHERFPIPYTPMLLFIFHSLVTWVMAAVFALTLFLLFLFLHAYTSFYVSNYN